MSCIQIKGMSFYANHGCFDEERAIGTYFRVDLKMEVDTGKAQRTDNIADTVNYADVYLAVKEQMVIPSHLLEHVADRIGKSLLKRFSGIESLEVCVAKLNPPLGGDIEEVCVEIGMHR